jgi:hypothetical protein
VRPSLIATARKSLKAYKFRVDQPYEPTPAMNWGSLVDALLFGTDLGRFAVYEGKKRGKDWEAWKAANGDHLVMSREDWDSAQACADALRAHPAVAKVLAQGEAQFSIQWTDEETGLACAGRPDFLSTATGLVVDLKTTSGGLNERQLCSSIDRWGYGLQVAMYGMGLRANAIDLSPAFIFVESEPPYDVAVVTLLTEQVAEFEKEVRRLLRRIAECERTGVWPGVSDEIRILSLPHWCFGPEIES